MITNVIRQQISEACSTANSSIQLRNHLQSLVTAQNGYADPQTVAQLETLLTGLIQELPDNLDALVLAADRQGVGHLLLPVIELIVQYYLTPNDFIPDQAGLLGLLDDTYLATALVYYLALTYQQETGVPLLSVDLGPAVGILKSVIGLPITSQLDQIVNLTLQSVALQYQQMVAQWRGTLNYSGSRTGGPGSWGNDWESEMARLGAEMGISMNF